MKNRWHFVLASKSSRIKKSLNFWVGNFFHLPERRFEKHFLQMSLSINLFAPFACLAMLILELIDNFMQIYIALRHFPLLLLNYELGRNIKAILHTLFARREQLKFVCSINYSTICQIVGGQREHAAGHARLKARQRGKEHPAGPELAARPRSRSRHRVRDRTARVCVGRDEWVRDTAQGFDRNAPTAAGNEHEFAVSNEAHDVDFFDAEAADRGEQFAAAHQTAVREQPETFAASKIRTVPANFSPVNVHALSQSQIIPSSPASNSIACPFLPSIYYLHLSSNVCKHERHKQKLSISLFSVDFDDFIFITSNKRHKFSD